MKHAARRSFHARYHIQATVLAKAEVTGRKNLIQSLTMFSRIQTYISTEQQNMTVSNLCGSF